MDVKIVKLSKSHEFIPETILIYKKHWPNYFSSISTDCIKNEIKDVCDQNSISDFILITKTDDTIIGCVSIKNRMGPFLGRLSPWMTSILVVPGVSRKKVEKILLDTVEMHLKKLFIPRIYVATENPIFFEKKDWHIVFENFISNDKSLFVLTKQLS